MIKTVKPMPILYFCIRYEFLHVLNYIFSYETVIFKNVSPLQSLSSKKNIFWHCIKHVTIWNLKREFYLPSSRRKPLKFEEEKNLSNLVIVWNESLKRNIIGIWIWLCRWLPLCRGRHRNPILTFRDCQTLMRSWMTLSVIIIIMAMMVTVIVAMMVITMKLMFRQPVCTRLVQGEGWASRWKELSM